MNLSRYERRYLSMANDINQVTLIGRLTRDAELKYTGGGTAMCRFALAVNRGVKRNEKWETEVDFFDCILWGKRGESLSQYLAKGKQIGVSGELRQNRWTNDQGQNRSKVEIHALNVQLLGGGKEGGQTTTPENVHTKPSNENWDGGPEDFEDDIPF
jgi:single-strand DNA-binding protein